MAAFQMLYPSEQVAAHLRGEILRGVWRCELPGAPSLSRELGVDAKTVLAALTMLENEGLLASQGVGRRRKILPCGVHNDGGRSLRIGILLRDATDRRVDYVVQILHGLINAGHRAFFAGKTQADVSLSLPRLRRLVMADAADAWVVASGSRETLEWFGKQDFPSFGLFGRFAGLPIGAVLPNKIPAYEAAVDRLVALGHRRIVLLARKPRRLPEPGQTECAFLRRLEYHGIPTGPFNLPNWEDEKGAFHALLGKLFGLTPPTALIIQEAFLFSATHHFLTRRGLRVPEDVSMVCTDNDGSFAWWEPQVSHIRWESEPIVRRVVDWAARQGRGKKDLRQTSTKAEFVQGGTIARVSQVRT